MRVRLLLLFCLCFVLPCVYAQTIRGEVVDNEGYVPITGVAIQNIYTDLNISTDPRGDFIIAATSGQLIEFRKQGYKTVRVRVPMGYVPPYFKIVMKKGITDIKDMDIAGNRYDYRQDSIRYHELYAHELDKPRMSGIDMVASPFSALSKSNRQVWQFQENYEEFEQEKYVDKTFNADLIAKLTGLQGDSLKYFMRRYRPTFEQLRGMNDYSFYNFIKNSAHTYRNAGRRVNSN